jgi:uncharacterized protein (DUF305 family)
MIPRHQQAIAIAKLADNNSNFTELKKLASQIDAEQQPQLRQLIELLQAWNAPTPDESSPANSIHGINYSQDSAQRRATDPPPEMNPGDQMRQLQQSSGPAFNKLFLQAMIHHNEDAIAKTQNELTSGQNPDARALAQRIIKAQKSELYEMQTILVGPDFGHF